MAVVLLVLSLISTLRTNRAFLSLTVRPPLFAEVGLSLEEETKLEADTTRILEVAREVVLVAVLHQTEVETNAAVVQGGDGETGTRTIELENHLLLFLPRGLCWRRWK